MRDAINYLKELVRKQVTDILKVDKGQVILIIDYVQRKKAEELNGSKITKLSNIQSSNWEENRVFVECIMKKLYAYKFISDNEFIAVTGGKNGKLKNRDGSIKYTHILSTRELFCKQRIPYVYPLFKVHKMSIGEFLKIHPNDVASKIESRLVAGMSSCQLTCIQIWLEYLLTPLAIFYGNFQFIKDSNDFLLRLERVKNIAVEENCVLSCNILFSVMLKHSILQ